jgi:hypothetical protein
VLAEAGVRDWLRAEVLARSSERTEAIYELWVPRTNARADVAVIGAELEGFEIKAERDTLRRLPSQAAAYGRLFDRCTVVLAERHLDDALDLVPEWWGVFVIVPSSSPAFFTARLAQPNECVDPELLVRLLWKDEVRAALSAFDVEPDRRASRSMLWRQLLALADLDSLKLAVRQALLSRSAGDSRVFRPRSWSFELTG